MLDGHATPAATERYASVHSAIVYRPLAETGLMVSSAGFGGYRVDASVSMHREALIHALSNGINLIDTSANYADGGSEALIGAVLQQLQEQSDVARQAVVVVSKGGYLQGQNFEMSEQRKAEGRPWPDLVTYAPGLEHCIHPEFLKDQLTHSLHRLQIQALDVYLLHNPEYYLSWAQKNGVELRQARETYYGRIELAFRHLEEEVARGRIQYYGISSNTFPAPAADPTHTSLSRVWQIAQDIKLDHHFRVIQLPANFLETGAMTEANQPNGDSVLAFARQHRLGVLINRPLNAIQSDRLLRLADVPAVQEADPERVEAAVSRLVTLETLFSRDIRPLLPVPRPAIAQLADIFSIGRLLQARWRGFGTYYNWNDLKRDFIVPRAQHAVGYLRQQQELQPDVEAWLQEYVEVLNEALEAISAVYAAMTVRDVRAVKERAAAADAAWAEAENLSQMAIRALRSTAGITTVLVGMRRQAYVDDVLAELRRPVAVAEREAGWQAMAALAGDAV